MFNFLKTDDKVIDVNEMDSLIGKIELIDIREPYEYIGGSLKGSKNIPMSKLINEPYKYLNKDKTYYIMCQSGVRSKRTCNALSRIGFNVINVTGGMGAYTGSKRN